MVRFLTRYLIPLEGSVNFVKGLWLEGGILTLIMKRFTFGIVQGSEGRVYRVPVLTRRWAPRYSESIKHALTLIKDGHSSMGADIFEGPQ